MRSALLEAYEAQAEVVAREKQRLKTLVKQLIERQRGCAHEFIDGACESCGLNEDVFDRTSAPGATVVLSQGSVASSVKLTAEQRSSLTTTATHIPGLSNS